MTLPHGYLVRYLPEIEAAAMLFGENSPRICVFCKARGKMPVLTGGISECHFCYTTGGIEIPVNSRLTYEWLVGRHWVPRYRAEKAFPNGVLK